MISAECQSKTNVDQCQQKYLKVAVQGLKVKFSDFDKELTLSKLQSLKCSGNNNCEQICSNKNCMQVNPYICLTKNCICRNVWHFNCSNIIMQSLITNLQRKILQSKQYEQKIILITDQIIDRISDFRDHLIKKLKQQKIYNGLTKAQRQFMDVFNEEYEQNIKKQKKETNDNENQKQKQRQNEKENEKQNEKQKYQEKQKILKKNINGKLVNQIYGTMQKPYDSTQIQNLLKTQIDKLKQQMFKEFEKLTKKQKSMNRVPLQIDKIQEPINFIRHRKNIFDDSSDDQVFVKRMKPGNMPTHMEILPPPPPPPPPFPLRKPYE